MSFERLHAALDAAAAPLTFFVRDDDGGWDDARLFALLDCTAQAGVPIDLAMIPHATTTALAATLCARMDAAPGLIGVHQHGFAHTNHETVERKCEFGVSRAPDAQREDLRAGRQRLHAVFGPRLDAIFTPPWNRCSAATPALLAALGYAALSRDRGAKAQQALPEVAVDLDWSKQLRAAAEHGEAAAACIARELARCIGARSGPIGVMLHHVDMQDRDLTLLAELLAAVKVHGQARWRLMRDCVALPGHAAV
jgi:predicted deacetylase